MIVFMDHAYPGIQHLNAEKSLALASALFPGEKWLLKEANYWQKKCPIQETLKPGGEGGYNAAASGGIYNILYL
jgi:hypothetical protein